MGGLLLAAVGLYGVIDSGSLFGLGLPLFAVAVVLCAAGLAVGGRRTTRSRYRPDTWGWPEWVVVGFGRDCRWSCWSLANALHVSGLSPSFSNLAVPPLPLLPVRRHPDRAAPGVGRRRTDLDVARARDRPALDADRTPTGDLHGVSA